MGVPLPPGPLLDLLNVMADHFCAKHCTGPCSEDGPCISLVTVSQNGSAVYVEAGEDKEDSLCCNVGVEGGKFTGDRIFVDMEPTPNEKEFFVQLGELVRSDTLFKDRSGIIEFRVKKCGSDIPWEWTYYMHGGE